MKDLTIGIMGCLINCSNLGCVALSYSLLQCLEEIANKNNAKFSYIIFDEKINQQSQINLAQMIGIPRQSIRKGVVGAPQIYNLKGVARAFTKKLADNIKMCRDIKTCDVVIDMTGGDSFSDIYGLERFYQQTTIKWMIEKLGVPLILGPQTYGPYKKLKARGFAKKVIRGAYLVMARDDVSADYTENLCGIKVCRGTDVAFGLKYQKCEQTSNKIRIGINPSGLLGVNKNEHTSLNLALKVDFDKYIKLLVERLIATNEYDIHFISHVGNEAIDCFPGYSGVTYHKEFKNPIEAKNIISGLDIFVGARMHATIAAFSSGVPVIPVAYSPKFYGLFHSLGYDYIVDIQSLETEEAVELTLKLIKQQNEMRSAVLSAKKEVQRKYDLLMVDLEKGLAAL